MSFEPAPWVVGEEQSIVLEIIQLAGDVALFADHRTKPDVAFSMPRKGWDDMGNPTVITVTAAPGGEFVPKGDKPQDSYVGVAEALAKLGGSPYASGQTGAYL